MIARAGKEAEVQRRHRRAGVMRLGSPGRSVTALPLRGEVVCERGHGTFGRLRREGAMHQTPHYRPTPAEHDIIVLLLAERLSPAEIAVRRGVKPDTITKQLRKLFDATGTQNELDLAYWCYVHQECCLGLEELFERLFREADARRRT